MICGKQNILLTTGSVSVHYPKNCFILTYKKTNNQFHQSAGAVAFLKYDVFLKVFFFWGTLHSALRLVELHVRVRHEVAQLADWQSLHGALTNPSMPLLVP
ncbi:hypothetical protein DSCOOX_09120 [Desulfosarcina ovata subsp. ovata]|uniref:Uncharacterized protein n=1 Tax=Desulfosarcina ovata subsp. ovata TaxID=2752305 RepID=A0A5K8A590_9BACT|nr:hypothetical protein DSCOOX_09120 [Desulfosarcina ovata subsp. ovata]